MINIHLEVSRRWNEQFIGELRAFEEYQKRLSGEILRWEAGLTSLAAIMFSAPTTGEKGQNAGLGMPAKKQGEKAVEKDIRSMFRASDATTNNYRPTMATSRANFAAWRNSPFGDYSKILGKIHSDPDEDRAWGKVQNLMRSKLQEMAYADRKVYIEPGQMRSLHDQERGKYRGRILRHRGPSPEVSASPYIIGEMAIKRYVKERQKRVGWMKAGWSHVIERIGTVNINGKVFRPAGGKVPQWVRRHGRGGSGMVAQNVSPAERAKHVKILNFAGDAEGVSTSYDVSRKVIDYRNTQINARPYQQAMDKAVELWNAGRIKARGF